MSQSTRVGCPYLAAAQAQKHVTVNESLLRLDALTQLSAKSATLAAEPVSPSDGGIYILPAGKTGAAWGAMANGALAYYRGGVWEELTPRVGWQCVAEDTNQVYLRTSSSAWAHIAGQNEHRLIFTPGGDGIVSAYGIDTARAQNPRAAAISAVAGDIITLTTADAGLLFGALMAGVRYARIWNTTKSPIESAGVKAAPAANQLQALNAADIAT